MPARKVLGPIPLSSGVQLDSPRGQPTGLLDAINMEERAGHLTVRRGSRLQGRRNGGTGYVSGVSLRTDVQDSAGTSITNWSTLSTVYIGYDDIDDLGVGEFVETAILDVSGAETDEPEGLTFEYWGDDDAWHRLDAGMLESADGARPLLFPPPTKTRLLFRNPIGWKKGTPTSTSLGAGYCWMRVSRTDGNFAATNATVDDPAFAFDIEVADFVHYRDRDGSYRTLVVAAASDGTLFSPTWLEVDEVTGGAQGQLLGNLVVFSAYDNIFLDFSERVRARDAHFLYIPAINRIWYYWSSSWVEIAAEALGTTAGTYPEDYQAHAWPDGPHQGESYADAGNARFLRGDIDGDASAAYQDIPLEEAFPEPDAVAIYAGRVFIAERRTGKIWWTAPDEVCRTLPSENQYLLASRASARVVAMVSFYGALYIFTEDGIWRATMLDPIEGQESAVAFEYVTNAACTARRSVVVTDMGVFFLASDGIRVFDGQRTRVVSKPLQDLFRKDSNHQMAVRNPEDSVGVWDPIENRYILFYRAAGFNENEQAIVFDLENRAFWLWGAEHVAGMGVPGDSDGPVGNRTWGPLGTSVMWHPDDGRIYVASRRSYVCSLDDEDRDFRIAPVAARAETHHIGLGKMGFQRMRQVDATVRREGFGQVKITSVADGRKLDSRTIDPEGDGVDPTNTLGGIDLSGDFALDESDNAYAPITARFAQKGRNHRVRIETVSPDHARFELAGLSFEVEDL